MRNYLLLVLTIFSCNTESALLENEYNLAEGKIDSFFIEVIQRFNDQMFEQQGNGPAILLKARVDTIESNNDYSNWKYDEIEKLEQDVWIAASEYNDGVLKIFLGQIFESESINIEVFENEITTTFSEHFKSDDCLKLNKSDPPTNELNVPLQIADVSLSKIGNYLSGEIIYGKVKIVTIPYFLKPMGSAFEKIKKEYECYFKFKVRDIKFLKKSYK